MLNEKWYLNLADEKKSEFDFVLNSELTSESVLLSEQNYTELQESNVTSIVKDAKQPAKMVVRPPMGRQASSKAANYTFVSRTGRKVCVRNQEMPDVLRRLFPAGLAVDEIQDEVDCDDTGK